MSSETITPAADEASVLADISGMLQVLLEDCGLEEAEITMDTAFHGDLELESIDLVGLAGQLREHYGDRVNFASFIAERDLEEIITLTIGELVRHVVTSLNDHAGAK
jgi:acyl carrier protein